MTTAQPILFTTQTGPAGTLGLITLNRPHAFNALNLNMLTLMHTQLAAWQADDDIKAVIVRGNGDNAFCAGGDIKDLMSISDHHQRWQRARHFFETEYHLNHYIHHYPKPYISFCQGITMGGGIGISLHGSHNVASPDLQWAMPEVSIGFFPDVGIAHYLSRMAEVLGWYLALTGQRINAADALQADIVTHVIDTCQWQDVIDALLSTPFASDANQHVSDVLAAFHQHPENASLSEYLPVIRRCFAQDSLLDIVKALTLEGTPWAQRILQILHQASPLSLHVTYQHLHRACNLSVDETLKQDLNLALHFMQGHDFYEGVRARILDKDQQPQWQPKHLQDIDSQLVENYFSENMSNQESSPAGSAQ